MTKPIPDIVVGRLPIYLRALSFLAAEGTRVTLSHDLGKRPGISAAQPTQAPIEPTKPLTACRDAKGARRPDTHCLLPAPVF